MKIGPMFKWFGSKWLSAKRYPKPEHNKIIEPFAGGAGYSLNYCDKEVYIWEDDPNISRLWFWLINEATSSDILDIPINVSEGTDIRTLGLSKGQSLLLKHWQRTNNVGDCWTISPWGNLPGQWTENTRARVAEEHKAINHWKISESVNFIDTPATWFIDPPYIYNYRYRSTLPEFNFNALSSMVQTISKDSQVIVCEAKRKEDGKIPDYLPFVESHSSVTSRRKTTQSHHSKEVVYIRGCNNQEKLISESEPQKTLYRKQHKYIDLD